MKQMIRGLLVLAGLAMAVPVQAATIIVSGADDGDPNTSTGAGIVSVLDSATPGNGTPGRCTLREAILTAQGQRAATVAECVTNNGSKPRAYCPFYPSGSSTAEESCGTEAPTATAASLDEITFAEGTRGNILLNGTLPSISTPLTIRGLGPDQTIITGSGAALAQANPLATTDTAPKLVELAIFNISPNLSSGAEVKLDNLTVRGKRVHYTRSASADVDCGGAGQPTCASADGNKSVINFAGFTLHNGVSSERKKLTLTNARLICNRRNDSGGAIAIFGRAALNLNTVTLNHNVSQTGAGGAIFAGAEDNGSPEVTIVNSRFEADGGQSCQDDVLANYATGTAAPVVCTSSSSSSSANSPCPAPLAASSVYGSYRPGNLAGAAMAPADTAAIRAGGANIPAVAAADAVASGGDGGALAVSALNATTSNIGAVTITGSRFLGNFARGNGGALSLAHVATSSTGTPAISIVDSLFSSGTASNNVALPSGAGANTSATNNRAAGNGGAISIIGNANQAASARFEKVSFSFNRANDDGGALHYVTQPGAPVDFTMKNIRISSNSAGINGGALVAADNGADDSGLLNIRQATFDNNVAAGNGGAFLCAASKAGSQFTNLTFSGNSANNGGAIFVGNRCHLAVNNNTIVDNASTFRPSVALRCRGQGCSGGGGILVSENAANARVDVRNSVIARNVSYFDPSTATNPDASLRETEFQNDTGPDCSAADNTILRSSGFNFIGTNIGCGPRGADSATQPFRSGVSGTACVRGSTSGGGTGDIVGNVAHAGPCSTAPLNPQLRVLSDNDGPDIQGARNFTHHPDTGSPLINAASSAGCFEGPVGTATTGALINVDERERARGGSAGRCDIGAVEVNGGLTPTTGTLSVTAATNIPTSIKLNAGPMAVEVMRLNISAPTAQPVRVQQLIVRREQPEGGIAGSYASLRGIQAVVVDQFGQPLDNPLYQINVPDGTAIPFDSVTGALVINFNSPLELQPGQSVLLAVKFLFDASLPTGRVAQADSNLMVATAAAGGLGVISFVGLVGFGLSRRRSLLVATLLAMTFMSGCSSDGGSDDDGARTFRMSARQLTFDTDAASGLQQSITVLGPTITITNP